MYSQDDILRGLSSKDKIKDNWLSIWNKESAASRKQSFSVGAERVIYYYLSNSKGLGEPNSTPVSADLMFETEEAFIHIDLKTAQTRNIGDISTSIFIGNNQNSYKGKIIVNNDSLEYSSGNLPQYYTYNGIEKPCLTYFITILHDEETLKTLMVNIMCMPNGQLQEVYGTDVLKAGKTKDDNERDRGLVSTVRFNFQKTLDFRLLKNKKRVKVVYLDENIQNNPFYQKKLKTLINIYNNQK